MEPHADAIQNPAHLTPALGPIRALVVDFDGTLTDDSRLSRAVEDAISAARRAGLVVVLATGRGGPTSSGASPAPATCSMRSCARTGRSSTTATATARCASRSEPTSASRSSATRCPSPAARSSSPAPPGSDGVVAEVLSLLGVDHQVVHNRGEIMILPPGPTKGSGARRALGGLGISWHNAVALGDGENDHSLLDACQWSATPSTAVPSLRSRADLVLRGGPGAALIELLDEHVLTGRPIPTLRRPLVIGTGADGSIVSVPSAGQNLLIAGGTRAGKSYLAGALAEQLVDDDHSVVVIDPEGDYRRLRSRGGTTVVAPEPGATDVRSRVDDVLRNRFGSVVLDLSGLGLDERRRVVQDLLPMLDAARSRTGAPHWLLVDEAHLLLDDPSSVRLAAGAAALGTCLVTFHPGELTDPAVDLVDSVVVVPGESFGDPDDLETLARISGCAPERIGAAAATCGAGQGILLRRGVDGCIRLGALTPRRSAHIRHREKYSWDPLPEDLHFLFRTDDGQVVDRAGDVDELHRALRRCPPEVVAHHARRHDLATWMVEAMQDPWTGREVHDAEDRLDEGPEAVRAAALRVLERRYLR